jgi:hypothetical protein
MLDVNRAGYAAAHRLIAAGLWIVDAEAGTVTGSRYGKQLGRTKPVGYYVRIYVRENGARVGNISAHRLIWEHVNGPIPDGLEINHRNAIKNDNRLANLELVTPGDNNRHAFALGLMTLQGEHNNNAKFTEQDIHDIRRALADGEMGITLAHRYGVTKGAISLIRSGKLWSHLADPTNGITATLPGTF